MSETSKRSGSRDISDLKARLGLKKSGGQPKSGGVVPPPGIGGPGNVPAPPGASAPAPATSNPFAGFGQQQTATAQPQPAPQPVGPDIVVVERGEEVEAISKKKGFWLVVPLLLLAPLIAGLLLGRNAQSNINFNQSIDDAKVIQADIQKVRKPLGSVRATLQAKAVSFDDKEALSSMRAFRDTVLKMKGRKPEGADDSVTHFTILEGSSITEFADRKIAEVVMQFYALSWQTAEEINAHLVQTRKDKDLLSSAKGRIEKSKPKDQARDLMKYSWAAIISIPDGKKTKGNPGVRIVKLGLPLCEDNSANESCRVDAAKFKYRGTAAGEFKPLEIWRGQPGAPAAPKDQLLPVVPTEVFDDLLRGDASVAEHSYDLRVSNLRTRVNRLMEQADKLEDLLKGIASGSRKFTFFM